MGEHRKNHCGCAYGAPPLPPAKPKTATVVSRVDLRDDAESNTSARIDDTRIGVLVYHNDPDVVIVDGREFSRTSFKAALVALADSL
jgi:hypothetical protein